VWGQQDFPPPSRTTKKPERHLPAVEDKDVIYGGATKEYLTCRLPYEWVSVYPAVRVCVPMRVSSLQKQQHCRYSIQELCSSLPPIPPLSSSSSLLLRLENPLASRDFTHSQHYGGVYAADCVFGRVAGLATPGLNNCRVDMWRS